jgi:oligoribonuclease NrnB/cAMP/cGMP phosphodiesterase (DHH superfamily)
VYIIDLGFTEPVLKEIKEKNKKVIVIDHHESVFNFTKKIADEYYYSDKEAACIVAWKYFFPKQKIPKLLKYVDDIDLWKFNIPYSKEIIETARLTSLGDFKEWNFFVKNIEDKDERKEEVKTGKLLIKYQDKTIEEIAEFAYKVKFENMKVLAVNSPVFRSQLGNLLAEKKPPLGIVWRKQKELIKISLRGNGSIDVSKIAKKYGGGGHPNAAAFTIPEGEKLPWKQVK